MVNGLWLSRSAVRGGTLPASAATSPGTWRHYLMWRITVHRLRALGAFTAPVDIWQAGTLHVVQHAPWVRGGASRIVFKPLADDFGETVVLILDYAGPAIATFMTRRHREASLRGPARAALSLTGHGGDGVSRNTHAQHIPRRLLRGRAASFENH